MGYNFRTGHSMINNIVVPHSHGQRYYVSHYYFFIEMVKAAGVNTFYKDFEHNDLEVQIDDKRILIDYCDHAWIPKNVEEFDIIFKYHNSKHISSNKRLYSLTPISFYDWREYDDLQQNLQYTADSDIVLNNQTPGASAKERREKVQEMLTKQYGNNFDKTITCKQIFWRKIARCLVSVCVPGARNNMLDRGQLQYWAFGACTISPRLDIMLPFWREPMPGMHYIECADDYSDLIEKIEWCRGNRDACREIGTAAKELFEKSCTPEQVWKWINTCLKDSEKLHEERR